MSKGIVYILIYFFVYRNLAFSPSPYCSYFNLFALFCCFYNMKKLKKLKKFLKIYLIILGMINIYLFSRLINNIPISCIDPLKVFVIRIILDINFIIFIEKYLGKTIEKKCETFFKGFIYSVFIDILLGLLRFKYQILDEIFLKVFPPRDITIKEILAQKVRLMGVGGYFFGGGVILAISLILIAFLLTNIELTKREKVKLKVLYILNLFLGILISRTTIIGFILSLKFSVFNERITLKGLFKILISSLIILLFVIVIYYNLKPNVQNNIYRFLFIQGEGSLKILLKMYNVFPKNLKTLIIGDGVWEDINGRYYMHIDVGYLRMIFFNGILGLIFVIFFNYNLTSIKNLKLKKLSRIIFFLFLILNLKGDIFNLSISIFIYVIYILDIKGGNSDKNKCDNSYI